MEKMINEVKEIMKKQRYVEVTKTLYRKKKGKLIHGCWRIGKKYFYFLKNEKLREGAKD